jgi:hypothetical protein
VNIASASPSSGSAMTVAIKDIMDPNYTVDCDGKFSITISCIDY